MSLEPHGQGYRDASPALEQLSALAVDGRLRHGDHPVMNLCVTSAAVEQDAAGNIKLTKKRSSGRIDGLTALSMAIAGMTAAAPVERKPAYQFFCYG